MNKTFMNDNGEEVECAEIATLYPTEEFQNLNAQERQAAADKNNGGKLGEVCRFGGGGDHQFLVDIASKVWWVQDYR